MTTSSAGALGGGAFGGGTLGGGAAGSTTMSGAAPASVSRPALSADGRGTAGDARNIAPGADISAGTTRSSGAAATSMLPGVRITADAVNNTLLIYANQESYRIIERTLRQLDRPQLQVAIEATIAEVTLNDTLNYGVQFFLKSSDVGLKPDTGSIINSAGGAVLARAFPGFNLLVGSAAEPRVILDALRNATDVKVLSNPSIVVLDNQVATLQVGDQIPVTTGTATVLNSANQVVSTIDYRNTGIILRVVPRINSNGNIVLDIEQEISNVTTPRFANAHRFAAQGEELDCGGDRSDRAARRTHQRNSKSRASRHSLPRQAPPARRGPVEQPQYRPAHRADHLHSAPDHS